MRGHSLVLSVIYSANPSHESGNLYYALTILDARLREHDGEMHYQYKFYFLRMNLRHEKLNNQ
jgi:hypothetical protein